MNVVFFVNVCCCTFVGRKLFLGTTTMTTTVAAHTTPTAVATKSISSSVRSSLSSSLSSSSSSSVTMIALAAGGRTLIEIGNKNINNNSNSNSNSNTNDDVNNQKEFEIDVSYFDDDDEKGLLILRRRVDVANTALDIEDDEQDDEEEDTFGSWKVDSDADSMMAQNHNLHNKSVLYKVSTTFKKMTMQMNPFVASSTSCILLGNIASMIGIIPIGLSGFVPAVSIMATVGILHKK